MVAHVRAAPRGPIIQRVSELRNLVRPLVVDERGRPIQVLSRPRAAGGKRGPGLRASQRRNLDCRRSQEFILADQIKEFVEEVNPLGDKATMFTDLITTTLSEVDWHEIAEAFLAE